MYNIYINSFIYCQVSEIILLCAQGVHQGCILSPCLFNFYAEYIMRNAGLDEAQAGIKIAGRNINNLRYADDTTLMAETEEELKSLLMKVNFSNTTVQKHQFFGTHFLYGPTLTFIYNSWKNHSFDQMDLFSTFCLG